MKKLIIATTVAAMLLSTASPVCAAQATYKTTKDFTSALDKVGYKYTVNGMVQGGLENVEVIFEGDYKDPIDIQCFFADNNTEGIFYSWNVIDFTREDVEDVIVACNQLNYNLPYVKFYIDTSDNSVTAELSYLMDDGINCGNISFDNMCALVSCVDVAYKALQQYNAQGTSHGSLGDLLYGQ